MAIPEGKHKGKKLSKLNYAQLYFIEKSWSKSSRLKDHPYLPVIKSELNSRERPDWFDPEKFDRKKPRPKGPQVKFLGEVAATSSLLPVSRATDVDLPWE